MHATPTCYGTWDESAPTCVGGFDPSYRNEATGSTVRDPCIYRDSCSMQTKQQQRLLPTTNLTKRYTPPVTPSSAYTPPRPITQYRPIARPPVTYTTPPAANQPARPAAPQQQHPQYIDPNAQFQQSVMLPMMQMMMQTMMQPAPAGAQGQVAAGPEQMLRMMQMMQMMQQMMPQHVERMPGTFPGMYQPPVNLSPVQLAATNFGVPSYLSSVESRKNGFWKPLGRELLRGSMKAVGQVLAHAADHYPFEND